MSKAQKNYGGLDLFRLAAALLVVAIHTSPLTSVNGEADFFFTRVLARIAVPFFLMVTGHFMLAELSPGGTAFFPDRRSFLTPRLKKYLLRLSLLYGASILLYLPVGIYAGHYRELTSGGLLRMLLFDGTFYHLWYFPACILGVLLVSLLARYLTLWNITVISAVLYVIGLFGDSYFGLAEKVPVLNGMYAALFQISSYTRNGVFLAPLFLVLGVWAGQSPAGRVLFRNTDPSPSADADASAPKTMPVYILGLILSFCAMTAEAFILHRFHLQRHDSMYVFLIPVMFFLYRCLLAAPVPSKKILRTASTWIYVLHPAFIVVIRGAAKLLHLTGLLVDNSLLHYLAVCLLSLCAGFVMTWLTGLISPHLHKNAADTPCREGTGRAWIELDSAALEHNLRFLQSCLPENCRLMPAVKANAYGHGAEQIAGELNRLGIQDFCVACVSEGINLRKAGIKGQILILGCTHPDQFSLLGRYHLTQTVVDMEYARRLQQYGRRLHVHIAVDTGMHRLGIRCEDVEQIAAVYRMKNLTVDGIFTHLAASDSDTEEDRAFTESQILAFYQVTDALEAKGCPCVGLHLLSSYGILNYPKAAADYVRPGIALYGVLSRPDELPPNSLLPVLSLKARVASVRTLHPGESAGYGMAFIAYRKTRIAVLSVGYADGLPRELSSGRGHVLIHGKKAPVIGRICMDQTLVDVSEIPEVSRQDTAVLIGCSGPERITAQELAEQCGTITNEILSRLGSRLPRIPKETL